MRYIILAIAILICTAADAQIIRAEPFYTAPEAAVSGNLLLDDYPGAAVAYSLRKLDKDYTGSAIRVRRSSDNTEQDIGFVNNYLDTAAMKTFVGANNGFVVTWYNQADSSGVFGVRNVTQSSASSQPRIINSGTIENQSGEVCLFFDGSNDFFISGKIPAFDTDLHSSISVFKTLDTLTSRYIYRHSFTSGASTLSSVLLGKFSGNNGFAVHSRTSAGGYIQSAYNPSNKNQNTITFFWGTDNTLYGYLNSQAFTSTGTGATAVPSGHNFFKIGQTSENNTSNYSGYIYELTMYASDKISDRTGIESNINSFYSIY